MAEAESPISDGEIAALRSVLIFAKAEKWFGRTRMDIALAANVTTADLDNFTSSNSSKNKPRSGRPHSRTLSRLLAFAANDGPLQQHAERRPNDDEIRFALNVVIAAFRKLPRYSPDDDHLFLHLKRIHAMDEKKCASVHALLSRYYYAYRFSLKPNRVIKSHFEIKPFHPARKVPTFSHHLRYDTGGPVRQTEGQVLDIGGTFVFLGFVKRGTFDYEGMKFMVLKKGGFSDAALLSGPFISYGGSESGHHVGFIQLVETANAYDAEVIGDFSLEDVQRDDPKFNADAILRTPILNGNHLVTALS